MKIRRLEKDEISKVSRIVRLNYSKKYEKLSRKELLCMFSKDFNKPYFFVAEDKGKILGFVGYSQSWADYDVYEIFWVNVLPEHQKQGVGTTLIKSIISTIKKETDINKARIVILTTDKPKFYKRLGFKILTKYKKDRYLMSITF